MWRRVRADETLSRCVRQGSLEEHNHRRWFLFSIHTHTHTHNLGSLVTAQSTRLDVSAVSIWPWGSGGFLERCWCSVYIGSQMKMILISVREWSSRGNRTDDLLSKSEGEQAKRKMSFHLFIWTATTRVNLPTSNNLIKKVPPRSAHSLAFYFIPNPVKWMSRLTITAGKSTSSPCQQNLTSRIHGGRREPIPEVVLWPPRACHGLCGPLSHVSHIYVIS